jgi:hypothetical protein
VPAFYATLQAQDATLRARHAAELHAELATLVAAAAEPGPFFLGARMSFVDVQLAPWLLRLSRVLAPYRAWPPPEEGSRWARWVEAVEADVDVRATTSGDELYLDSYERYAGEFSIRTAVGGRAGASRPADLAGREPAEHQPGGGRDQRGTAAAVTKADGPKAGITFRRSGTASKHGPMSPRDRPAWPDTMDGVPLPVQPGVTRGLRMVDGGWWMVDGCSQAQVRPADGIQPLTVGAVADGRCVPRTGPS